jgi:ubiquinone/menaquinone biosynthesis C-methylase UbiE
MRACDRIGRYLPQARTDVYELYRRAVGQYMNSRTGQVVVDVGGGRSCTFAKLRDPTKKTKIIAVDISAEELKHNTDVDERRIADVVRGLPLGPEEIDILTSESVLEHLESLEDFVRNSKEAMKAGGYFIHVFPSRFAPFALINRALPHFLSTKVLYFVAPHRKGIQGFPAFYDRCYYSGIIKLLETHGFDVIDARMGYHQSLYYQFFVPLFLVSALYEMLIQAIGARDLAAYVLIIARKR